MHEIYTLKRSIAKTVFLSAVICCVAPFGANDKQLTVAATVQEEKAEIYSHIYKKYRTYYEQQKMITVEEIIENIELEDELEEIEENLTYTDYDVPSDKLFKSYMDARHITNKNSQQYRLKSEYILDETGIYKVDNRFCCALGSYYTTQVGTYFDIVMKSGEIIPCILADCKADEHTDNLGQYTISNDSIVEFVVDTSTLIPNISNRWGNTGDVSSLGSIFDGEISYIRIYE